MPQSFYPASPRNVIETFPPLLAIPGLQHGFVCREPSVDAILTTNRDAALDALRPRHIEACHQLGFHWQSVATAEQVHADRVILVEPEAPGIAPKNVPGADGLIVEGPGLPLAIYVADCAAVSLVDPRTRALGLVHSGKRGSDLGIVKRAIEVMRDRCDTEPADLVVHISPCIRPPLYEIDLPALIRESALSAGVVPSQIHDCGISTGEHLERYYSYRMEKGATGRMLALLGWQS